MRSKILTILMTIILTAGIFTVFNSVGAVNVTLTLSDAELSTQFVREWGPGNLVAITDILGPGVRFDFTNLGGGGTGVGDNYPVSQLAGGASDSIGGWGNFRAFTQYRLVFTNFGPNPISANLMMNTGWTGSDWRRNTYWENSWIYVGVGESRSVTLDFSSAKCYSASDDPVLAWQYIDGTSGVIVRRLDEVSHIGFQICGNGASSVVVTSTIPTDTAIALPGEELSTQFAKETGPGALAAASDLPGMGVRFDFTGLTSSGTIVGDNFPVSALAGGAWKDYGSGFAGPYDFSAYAKYCLLFTNVGTTQVTVNLKINTGWTGTPWGTPQRDTFWQGTWTTIAAGESRIVTLDFLSAEVYNALDDPVAEWQYSDGTTGVIVRRLEEVSDIGFQIQGAGAASIIVSGETVLTLADAEMNTQFAKETGPGTLTTITDIPGPGVKFDFTGLRTDAGTVVGDSFPVSAFAGGAYKTYGVLQMFSTWGDFFEYTKYRVMFTNVGTTAVTVNLKMNTGYTIPPPEYAAAWRDTFWQTDWTSIAAGETKTFTLNLSSAEVYNAGDEQEYGARPDGTKGVTVWRLDEVSDIGFQILAAGSASIIVSARSQPLEVYVDDGYTSLIPGWGYDHFAKVQDGIDAVNAGGIVHVYDGTYNEALYIAKPVTVKAGSAPVIQGSQLFATTYGNREAVIFVKNTVNVILNGLDIEGQGFSGGGVKNYGIIYENSSGTVQSCTISPNMIGNMYSTGIAAWSGSNLAIKDSTIKNFGRIGAYATNVADMAIENNDIIGQVYSLDNLVNYGIEIEDYDGASTATIIKNRIYNSDNTNPNPLWSSAAIIIDIWRQFYNLAPSTVTILNNDIHNNFLAIELVSNAMSYAHYNDIYSNRYGVWVDPDLNNNNETFDARFNWWGDATGPKQETTNPSGLGNDAGDYVDYSPWLGFVVGTTPMTWHVNPSGGSDAIQEAIDEASPGDTIKAEPGTYSESQITISKSLIVTGSGADITIINGGNDNTLPTAGMVRITADAGDVTFSGFTLRNAGTCPAEKGNSGMPVRFCIYASSDQSGLTYTISDNKLYGTNDPNDEEDYGFYTNGGKENLVLTNNMITQTGANPILIERHTGPVEISLNTLDVGVWGSDAIFCMTYGGDDIITPQKVCNNTIDVGTGGNPYDYDHRAAGITFASSFGGGSLGDGKFTNIQITGNTIKNLKSYRRGVSLWNGNGAGGNIIHPIVTGNTITGVVGSTQSIGIRLLGLVSNAMISRNTVTSCTIGICVNATATATIKYNDIESNGDGILIDSDNNIIERNKIFANLGTYSGIHLTSTANGNQVHYNCIVGNSGLHVYGIYKEGGSDVNATYNWWGDSTGPYHPTKNPSGLGNQVSNCVLFDPWLKAYFDYYPENPIVGEPVTFNASLSVQCVKTIVSYTWNFADGSGDITVPDPIIAHTFTAPGNYNVTMMLTYDDSTTVTEWSVVHVSKKPYFQVEPQLINVGILNKTFQIDVTINDLDASQRAVGLQFRLLYDDKLLELINVTEGTFMKDPRWNHHGTYFIYFIERHPRYGSGIILGILLLPDDNGNWDSYLNGSGTLATLTFKAIRQERGLDKLPLTCNLAMVETMILDDQLTEVPHDIHDGLFKMHPTNIGDINFDGKVDMKDIGLVARAFGTVPGDTRWNEAYDVNWDGKIDMRDVGLVARNFGWTPTYDP